MTDLTTNRRALLRAAAGLTGAAVLGLPTTASAMNSKVTSATLTRDGRVVVKGPITWDTDESTAVFVCIINQAGRVDVAQSKRYTRGAPGFQALTGVGSGFHHGPCEVYVVSVITRRDGVVEWYEWPNSLRIT